MLDSKKDEPCVVCGEYPDPPTEVWCWILWPEGDRKAYAFPVCQLPCATSWAELMSQVNAGRPEAMRVATAFMAAQGRRV